MRSMAMCRSRRSIPWATGSAPWRPLAAGGPRPIIVGGTGLYFRALTEGLAEIPPIPPEIRAEAEALPPKTCWHGFAPMTR
jgi:hypothetical protein